MVASIEMVSMSVFVVVFLATCLVCYFVFWRAYGDDARTIARLRSLATDTEPPPHTGWKSGVSATLARLGDLVLPQRAEQVAKLKSQLVRAGLFQAGAARMYFGVKFALMALLAALAGLVPYVCGWLPLAGALIASSCGSAAGLLIPSLWLQWQVGRRQNELRAALPDFLDMLVLCLEGGMSLTAALPRVINEMLQVHPILGSELIIAQQTANLGLSFGDAFKQLGERCGLTEVKDLAAVVLQSERFGASLVKTLRMHADAYRVERQQRAEELAQRAAVKILFPMLLFIFPAIFIVLLGPAAFQIMQMFAK